MASRGRHGLGRGRAAMTARDGVILTARRDVTDRSVSIELEAIGRDLTLRDRCAEAQRRVDQHSAVGGLAQSAAGGARVHERLHEHGHGGFRGIEIVSGHVAQRARGPERGPARPAPP